MKIVSAQEQTFTVVVSREELLVIHQAFNEVCNGLPLEDFENRMGVSWSVVEEMLEKTSAALDKSRAH